jgi:hypothetical protein
MLLEGKSWRCVNISAVLTSAAVGAFTPGWLTVGKLSAGVPSAVAEWRWLGVRDAAIWQGLGWGTGKVTEKGTEDVPWTIGDSCECNK